MSEKSTVEKAREYAKESLAGMKAVLLDIGRDVESGIASAKSDLDSGIEDAKKGIADAKKGIAGAFAEAKGDIAAARDSETVKEIGKKARVAAKALGVAGVGAAAVAADNARERFAEYTRRGREVVITNGPAVMGKVSGIRDEAARAIDEITAKAKAEWERCFAQAKAGADKAKEDGLGQCEREAAVKKTEQEDFEDAFAKAKAAAKNSRALLSRARACAKKRGYAKDGKAWAALEAMAKRGDADSIGLVEKGAGALSVERQSQG